jgi:hypothetical protein
MPGTIQQVSPSALRSMQGGDVGVIALPWELERGV